MTNNNNTENSLIDFEEFTNLLNSKGNIYVNPNGVEIDYAGEFYITFNLWQMQPTPFAIWVEASDDNVVQTFNIRTWDDVDAISKDTLWELYLNGKARIVADFEYLCNGAELVFKVIKDNTVIICDKLIYHDRLAVILDNIDDIRAYVRTNIEELYLAAEKR